MKGVAPSASGLPLRAFYFFYYAVLGTFIPYWPLYLVDLGYTAAQIGWIMAILPVAKIVSPGIWGWLADENKQTLGLVRLATFLSLCSFIPLLFHILNEYVMACSIFVFGFFWSATLPLFEVITLEQLSQNTSRYSRIRLWGSVGFILAVGAAGGLFRWVLAISDLPWVLAFFIAGQFIAGMMVRHRISAWHGKPEGLIIKTLFNKKVLGFMVGGLLVQVAHGPYYSFFSYYLQQNNYSDLVIGALWALGVGAEIFLFWFMPIMFSVLNTDIMLSIGMALGILRWGVIAFGVENISLIIIAQLFHAASFGLVHIASIQFMHAHFQGADRAKGQAVYAAVCYGMGGAIGSLLAGELWLSFGGKMVFVLAMMIGMIALAFQMPIKRLNCNFEGGVGR